MSRFGQTEKIIFTFAMIVLMALSYFLYDDSLLFPKANNSKLDLIGSLSNSQNDVRRKNLDTFSWIPATKKDSVYQNDSIFTGDNSKATIQLQDGTKITIDPNSLITLNNKNGQMTLDLRYGNLVGELASGSALTVKSGSEEFELKSSPGSSEKSQIKFNKTHSGDVDLKLLSGNLKFIDKKKNAAKELAKNATVAVTKKGDLKDIESPELVLITPDNTSWTRINPDDPISFAWESKGDIAKYEIEVSPNEDFSNIAISKGTQDKALKVTDPLAPGSYYWRVKALTSSGQVGVQSQARKMTLSQLSSPQIVTPIKSALYNLEIKSQGNTPLTTKTELQWQASPVLKRFIWQISKDPEFTDVLDEDETESLTVLTPALNSGTYWVRVQGETEDAKKSSWSEPVPFTLNLTAQKEERPDRPILIAKEIHFKTPSGKDRNPASPQAPKLAWKPVLRSKNYVVQISKDLSFKETLKYDINQSQTLWNQYRPGKYYYRVFARGTNGLISEPSEVGSIDVEAGSLTLEPLKSVQGVGKTPEPKDTPIRWSEVPFAKSYLVQLDKDKNFSNPQKMEYNTNGGTLTLKGPGEYHVRVQAIDEQNKPLTDFSNIEEVLYHYTMPLQTPSLMEPFNNASIFLQTEMEPFIWLEWKKVKGATVYKIEVSDKEDFSKILISKSLPGNRFLLKDRVPLGKIYWRVRAESGDEKEISEWTEKREFTLYHQKNETFIK